MAKRNGGIIGPDNVPAGPLGAAGGVWRLEDAFNYQKAGLWPTVLGYQVPNSLRFNSGSSDRLNRTSSSQTAQKFTFSCWFKLSSNFTGRRNLFATDYSTNASTSGQSGMSINVWQDSTILSGGYGGSVQIVSTALFRDPGAWYHLVWAVDTTQATASNRLRIYINGSEITSFSQNAYPPQNQNIEYKNHSIGSYSDQATYGSSPNYTYFFDGYQSECYLIDGQQLTPSSFGETDTNTGVWIPKAYTGTYGTNGFYLKFANSSSLGTDSSGNGNTFTVNNLTSIDQTTDTPTNNFATLNPLVSNVTNAGTASEGNLQYLTTNAGYFGTVSTMGVSQGKWYCEIKMTAKNTVQVYMVGIDGDPNNSAYNNLFAGGISASYGYYGNDGNKWNNNSGSAYGSAYDVNDIISIAMDLDNNKLYFAKNGTWQNSGVPTSGATGTGAISISSSPTSGFYFFAVGDAGSTHNVTMQCNFGNPPYTANGYTDGAGYGNFSYSVPSGYYALCSKNLANYG